MNETRERPRRYPSKVDALLICALLGVPVVLFVEFAMGVLALPGTLRLATLALLAGLFGLLLWFTLATHYSLDATTLTVRSGPMHWVIELTQIESVTPTRDARSGPALSLDRLSIRYGGGRQMLISPREQEAFVHDLERRRNALQTGGPSA